MDIELHQARAAAKEEVQSLHNKLEEFENEAMYELEELQSELLEARASNEDLRQQLGESEHKRCEQNDKLHWQGQNLLCIPHVLEVLITTFLTSLQRLNLACIVLHPSKNVAIEAQSLVKEAHHHLLRFQLDHKHFRL